MTDTASHAGDQAGLPEFLTRPPRGFYRTVNPATKLAVAALEVVAAFLVPGWIGPLVVLAVVVATAAATLPVVASIVVVNLFLLPGASDAIVRIGPIAPTWSGLWFGLQTTARFLAFSLAIGLVYLTTPVDDLLADLERRGVGRRAVFVVGSAVETVPRMIERAGEIVDAQRARGLDTQGRFYRRAAGVVPLAAPLVMGTLAEVEERTLALEARAFTAPGRTTLLRVPADTTVDRVVRWTALLVLAALMVVRISGRLG